MQTAEELAESIGMKIRHRLENATNFDSYICSLRKRTNYHYFDHKKRTAIMYYAKIPQFLVDFLQLSKGDRMEVAIRKLPLKDGPKVTRRTNQ